MMEWDAAIWGKLIENSILAFAFLAIVILFCRHAGQQLKAQEQARKDYAELAGPVFDTVIELTRTVEALKERMGTWEAAMNRMKDRCPYLKEVHDNEEREMPKGRT